LEIIEIIGFLFAVLGIYYSAKRKLIFWPLSIISSSAYMFFFYEINLYADSLLQIFFILSSSFGWYSWYKNLDENSDVLIINSLNKKQLFKTIAIILFSGVIIGFIFKKFSNADYAYYDSILFSASVVSTILSAKAYIENWYFWIVINSAYILLYISKQAHLTAILYLILIGLAILGLRDWKKNLNV
jgi:nicotinamide mononucleotide transporter